MTKVSFDWKSDTNQELKKTNKPSVDTSYLTDSYIVFTLKMESVSESTIFG